VPPKKKKKTHKTTPKTKQDWEYTVHTSVHAHMGLSFVREGGRDEVEKVGKLKANVLKSKRKESFTDTTWS
jgi:hypothetical protein